MVISCTAIRQSQSVGLVLGAAVRRNQPHLRPRHPRQGDQGRAAAELGIAWGVCGGGAHLPRLPAGLIRHRGPRHRRGAGHLHEQERALLVRLGGRGQDVPLVGGAVPQLRGDRIPQRALDRRLGLRGVELAADLPVHGHPATAGTLTSTSSMARRTTGGGSARWPAPPLAPGR